ncbi:MAG: Rne/Rng family ribonuclease [Candidatus Cloacimonetes bacterium]|jgi:ribonuclease G|nr:Rne/Rng family ribonuclease [Candidatus Cloacimonadota bacterium]MBT6994562.1 Rne/Rng family ribonuclease [Candidatus Cloacimonadota bacterium]MBT7470328.1 Rne/Rng family ribonuclease [Candidatus Cloacimonadota bacterium]
MHCEIIVNVNPFETRIAIIEDHKLVELFAERKEQQVVIGNIYKGIISNVLPGMGAAFIDIGLSRAAFLHYRDISTSSVPKAKQKLFLKGDSSNIGKILSVGQEITVQVTKDPIQKKGARVSGKISLPGKFLVYKPNARKVYISRKITNKTERARIHSILKSVKEKEAGVIVRTDTVNIDKKDFTREYSGLSQTWKLVQKQMKHAKAPYCVYDDNSLSFSLIRDLFNSKVDKLIIDDKKISEKIKNHLKAITPELTDRIEFYGEDTPIFNVFGVEKEIELIFNSRVKLPSGGNITIQQTEALVAIDINTGSFTGKNDYNQTIAITNIEAAKEIARQIRLRDLAGILVIDFIDMKSEENQEKVFSTLKKGLKNDRAKHKVYPFSQLGLVEISRKRTRGSLLLTYSTQCPHCNGTGRLISRDSVAIRISRWLQRTKYFIKNEPLRIVVHKNVKAFLEENPQILQSENNQIEIEGSSNMKLDEFKVYSQITKQEITLRYST